MKTFITGSRERKPPVVARTERRKVPRDEQKLRMGKPLYSPAFTVAVGDFFEAAVPGYN
jgi:hypothetical protein